MSRGADTTSKPATPQVRWHRRIVQALLYGRNVDRDRKARARLGLAMIGFAVIYCVIAGKLVIFAIALLVFGPKKLPELGKGLGESIKGFKQALSGGDSSPTPSSTRRLERRGPGRAGRPDERARPVDRAGPSSTPVQARSRPETASHPG